MFEKYGNVIKKYFPTERIQIKKLILSTFVIALLLLAIAAGTANAGLAVGPSTGQLIAADDNPNMPTIP